MRKAGKSWISLRLKYWLLLVAFIASSLTLTFSQALVYALDEETLDRFAANNIMFYDPDEKHCDDPSVTGITYIGDSLSMDALSDLQAAFPDLDTKDRTYDEVVYHLVDYNKSALQNLYDGMGGYSGYTTLQMLLAHNELNDHIIFALGTFDPGDISTSILDSILAVIGERKIMFVTNYSSHNDGAYTTNNDAFKSYATQKENVYVADWANVVVSDPDRYIDDVDGSGVLLTPDGAALFADTISSAVKDNWSEAAASTAGGSSVADNKNYKGDEVWSQSELDLIEKHKPFYEAGVAKYPEYNIPWQAVAAVHAMESSLSRTNPSNGQGLFQMFTYTNGGKNSNAFTPGVYADDAEFARQIELGIGVMVEKLQIGGYDTASEEGLMYMLTAYNGLAQRYKDKAIAMGFDEAGAARGEGSPYTMNRYDEKRDPNSPNMDPNWPGYFCEDSTWCDGATMSRFGSYVKLCALGGCKASNLCKDDGDLIATVKAYAWPEYHKAGTTGATTPTQDYAEAIAKRQSEGKWVGGTNLAGIDCGGFVSIALNDSGYDPDYNYGGDLGAGSSNITYGQLPWLASTDTWKMVNSAWNKPISDESELSPGDVAFSSCTSPTDCAHTYLYVGDIEGFGEQPDGTRLHIASASWDERAPCAGWESIISSDGIPVVWYHKVK